MLGWPRVFGQDGEISASFVLLHVGGPVGFVIMNKQTVARPLQIPPSLVNNPLIISVTGLRITRFKTAPSKA